MEQLDYNLLFAVCWARSGRPRLGRDDLHKNRERLQRGDVFRSFMTRLLNHPQVKPLLSDEISRWTERDRGLGEP